MFIFILSCTPVNNLSSIIKNKSSQEKVSEFVGLSSPEKKTKDGKFSQWNDKKILEEAELILPKKKYKKITQNLINSFELSIYKKRVNNISLSINRYSDLESLEKILEEKSKAGKVFIGTLSSKSSLLVKQYCDKGILFFSFASKKSLAGDCVYLVNFFPEDDLKAIFDYLPPESKVALLYPENYYGYNVNKIIDPIASKSESIIINRASYREDLTNAHDAIKELGKYTHRKYELERQKKILQNKDDEFSKRALKKINKFQTLGNVDFTHLILPDYSIRLLEIAPLLPFYDVDPKKVKFIGTGVWDDSVFFNEPALQGAIFSGIEESNRRGFFNSYYNVYKEKPIRTSTIPYDLVGILSYIVNKKMNLGEAYYFLNNSRIKFDGIDGKFFFKDNVVFRELNILQIMNGTATKLN